MLNLQNGTGIQVSSSNSFLPFIIQVFLFDASFNAFGFQFEYDLGLGDNIRMSVDTNHNIGAKIVNVYVGVSNTPVAITVLADDVNNLLVNWADGSNPFSITSGTFGYLTEFWFGPGQFFDPTNKFIDGSGNPVALGATGELPSGTAPAVFLHLNDGDPASAFLTNRGTGGDFDGNAATCELVLGTRFADNLAGTGALIATTQNQMLLAPTSPTD